MDFPKFGHPDPENRVWHVFKKFASLDETLKRMKRIKKNEKMDFLCFSLIFAAVVRGNYDEFKK